MNKTVLIRRLFDIRKKYSELVDEIETIQDIEVKLKYLRLELILNRESAILKEYLDILVEDPCPKEDFNIPCAMCPEEKEHVRMGIITPRKQRFYDRESPSPSRHSYPQT